MYLALGVTTATYVLISLGVFGTLTVDQVTDYGETAIAEAARPALGEAGFVMMAIAALLATASSVNATLYASGGPDRQAGRDRPVPAGVRHRLAARLPRRADDHQRDRARGRQPRRPVGDRLGRQRLLAAHLPARRHRRLPTPRRTPDRAPRSSWPPSPSPRSCSPSSPSTRCATHPRPLSRSSRSRCSRSSSTCLEAQSRRALANRPAAAEPLRDGPS